MINNFLLVLLENSEVVVLGKWNKEKGSVII